MIARNPLRVSVLLFASLLLPATVLAAGATSQPADVPVKVVVLYSSGVGYFEHAGAVDGNATTELRFKTQQINDILKSLLLEDLGGGKVNAVVYPSQEPVAKTLRSFQVDITANPSLADLLNQLRGAKVKLKVGAEELGGTILGLEKKPKAIGEKQAIEVWYINLIAGASIRAIELDQVTQLQLEDQQLQEELNKALMALSQARDKDKKPVSISFRGEGQRQVRIGYVVETPVWKSSYRLVLPVKPEDKPKLQGWAIVENQTDNDWTNVQLSLVSGRPISFIQDLYQPLYIPRPVVQPELYASLRPQTYEAGMEGRKMQEQAKQSLEESETTGLALAKAPQKRGAKASGGAGAAPSNAPAADFADKDSDGGYAYRAIDATKSVASVASATKVGELFEYTVGSVSLPRQRSAMIPIVTEDIEVEKLSIYNASVLPRNPLNGARVKNTTGKHLLAGPITVLEASTYAGDAQIDNVPPNQERFLSYGIDLQMLVDATKNSTQSAIRTGSIVKGVLKVTYKYEYSHDYIAQNKADKDKSLIVEHPRRGAEIKLVEPAKPLEMTDQVYRFKTPVPAGKSVTLTVKEEQVSAQQIAILASDIGQLEFYTRSGAIPKGVKDALADAIKRKGALVDAQRAMEQLRQKKQEIVTEQMRIRENMKTVSQSSAYYTRLLGKLNEQETALEKLDEQIGDQQKAVNKTQKELEDYLQNLNVDEK